ncbi:MAG: CHAT domain-containing protein, partial [Blastocatellia bacterium]
VYLPSATTLAALKHFSENQQPNPLLAVFFVDPVFDVSDCRVTEARSGKPDPSCRGLGNKGAEGKPRSRNLVPGSPVLRLPATEDEARILVDLHVPKELYRSLAGFDVDRKNVMDSLRNGKYRLVHFGTHASIDPAHPENSEILLSQFDAQGARVSDGILNIDDIYRMRLPLELVTLSACKTSVGGVLPGEGVVSLARAFTAAGSKRVVSSLWEIPDDATANLLRQFYRYLLGPRHLAPGAALRQAQIDMANGKTREWRAPYFWAGFTLQGDWGPNHF